MEYHSARRDPELVDRFAHNDNRGDELLRDTTDDRRTRVT
jgi:hypothetical protein